LVPLHLRGEGVPVHWSDEDVFRHARHTLTLDPGIEQRPTPTEVL
jgi:hypothetical protein